MKVCFETFGCRLNRAEALEMESKFAARGWSATDSHAEADIIVVRGCSVTQRAQRDCEKLVEHLREKYPAKRLVVTGCMKDRRDEHWLKAMDGVVPDAVPRRTARAYLKVQDGCSSRCSFCIVPQFRGTARSVPLGDVLDSAERFIDAGYRELVVTGCSLAQYASEGSRLPDLVDALAALSPTCRVRLGSVEPVPGVAAETVAAMSARPNVCRYLHLPVQSGSDRVLAAMRRPYKVADVESIASDAAKLMPGLGLACDVMTGFPDEADIDFERTKSLLKRLPFVKAHVFPYSERPGTDAAKLPGALPPEVRSARAHELADAVDAARTDFAKRFKGRVVEVIVERQSTLAGWTSEYLWCEVGESKAKSLVRQPGAEARGLRRRALMKVRVRDCDGHVLRGDPV